MNGTHSLVRKLLVIIYISSCCFITLVSGEPGRIYNIEKFEHPLIANLTQGNFDEVTNFGLTEPWVVVFFIHTCPYCKDAVNAYIKHKEQHPGSNIKLGKGDCEGNFFLCLRFNINRTPQVVLLNNGKMIERDRTVLDEDNFLKFLNEDPNMTKSKDIPPSVGYVGFILKSVVEAFSYLNAILDMLARKYIRYDFAWTEYHTIGLFLAILVTIIGIEFLCIYICCGFKSKKKVAEHKQTSLEDLNTKNNTNETQKSLKQE